MTATVVHVLVERGVFGYDTRIAELWPEFGAHGKENATIRHALTHSVGVPGLPEYTVPEDLCDWDRMCAVIADTEPWWEPGTKVGPAGRDGGVMSDVDGVRLGMVGAGGTAAYADTATGVAFAVTKNRFSIGDLTVVERVADIITRAVANS